jgi:hypothetical protein
MLQEGTRKEAVFRIDGQHFILLQIWIKSKTSEKQRLKYSVSKFNFSNNCPNYIEYFEKNLLGQGPKYFVCVQVQIWARYRNKVPSNRIILKLNYILNADVKNASGFASTFLPTFMAYVLIKYRGNFVSYKKRHHTNEKRYSYRRLEISTILHSGKVACSITRK